MARVPASSMALVLALMLAWAPRTPAAEPATGVPATTDIVVTTVAPLDAQRLADVLRAYLDDMGLRVEPLEAGKTGGLRQQLDEARRLGQAAGATTVVRVERAASDGNGGGLELELIDLTTDEVVIATIASPARDEDRYRALALKIQAILRGRWSAAHPGGPAGSRASAATVAGGGSSPQVPGADAVWSARFMAGAPAALALDVGLGLVSFPLAGPVFDGLDVRARWLPTPHIALTMGTVLLGAAHASHGDVDAVATMIPVRATATLRLATGRATLFAGPAAELSLLRVAASSATTPVRSVSHVMVALGGEAEGRLALAGPLWLYARAAALGVLNGERYDAAGAPLIDTSRFELSGTLGLAIAIP